jgi:serine/threonine protein kinase, bacterial
MPVTFIPRVRDRRRLWIRAAVLVEAVVVGLALWAVGLLPGLGTNAIKLVELDDGVFIGSPRATAIDVFNEPICVTCGLFIQSKGPDMQRAVNGKKIAVRYHLLNFFNEESASGDYSTRAIAATLCVADIKDPNRYQALYNRLFAADFQPKKNGSADRTQADLAHLAQTLKAPPSVSNCITSGQRVPHAKKAASHAEATLQRLLGVVSVPQVFLGAREVDCANTGWIDTLS